MGFIAELANRKTSNNLWRQTFGAIDKETSSKPSVVPGGTHGRSLTATDVSFIRLLQAMRSMAPGGWSDDRWEQTKHWTGVTYVAGHRICTQWQQAEFQVFKKDQRHPDGKRPVREGEEGWDLVKLLEKPNKQDSFGRWMYRLGQQKYLTGTALTWMVPNVLGTPMELYCIPTAVAIPQPAINPDYPDGYYRIQPVYPYGPFSSYPTPTTAVGAPIPAQWMMRIQFPHPLLRYDGYTPLTGMRLHIDEIEMVDRARHYMMRRGINPSAVLNMEEMEGLQNLPEAELERIRADFEASHMGPENSGQLFVSYPGAKLEPWGAAPIDMAFQDGWSQLTDFVLGGGFGITKGAAGLTEGISSYAALFSMIKQLHLMTLKPDLDDVGSSITTNIAPFFGEGLYVDVRCPRIDDHDIKLTKLDKAMQGKVITKNELRKELDLPLTNEPWGEELVGMEGMGSPGPGQQLGESSSSQSQEPGDILRDAIEGGRASESPDLTKNRVEPGDINNESEPRIKKYIRASSNGKVKHA
jgi:phage portal protein BeeE